MATKQVTIVGVGALGSHFVQFARNEAVSLRVIDFDRIEQKNVQAQFHGKPNVGKMKSAALKQLMNFMYGLRIDAKTNKLVENNIEQLLGGADVIVDCLDNAASRRLVQGYVREKGIPCLHGALAADGTYGRVMWDEYFVIDDEPTTGAATCEGGEHLPFIAAASAYMAQSLKMFLTDGTKKDYSITTHGVF